MTDSNHPAVVNLQEVRTKRERARQVVKTNLHEGMAKVFGESAAERGDLGFIHTLHANCYLPRTAQKSRRYTSTNGPFSIMLEAGALLDKNSNGKAEWVDQPLPYGGKPRALLAYINSYAMRHQTAVIPLGSSLSDFVKMMSNGTGGGATGPRDLWKKQMMALSACTMRLGGDLGQGTRTKKVDIIQELELWFPPDPKQLSFFPSELVLNPQYLETLQEHAMPIDLMVLRNLQHDPLAYDVYLWLVNRLPRVRQSEGVRIPWSMMFDQFAGSYSDIRFFKRRFLSALRKARSFYLAAKVEETKEVLILRHSAPAIGRVMPARVRKLIENEHKGIVK